MLIEMRCIDVRYFHSTFKIVKVCRYYLIVVSPNREIATLWLTNMISRLHMLNEEQYLKTWQDCDKPSR